VALGLYTSSPGSSLGSSFEWDWELTRCYDSVIGELCGVGRWGDWIIFSIVSLNESRIGIKFSGSGGRIKVNSCNNMS